MTVIYLEVLVIYLQVTYLKGTLASATHQEGEVNVTGACAIYMFSDMLWKRLEMPKTNCSEVHPLSCQCCDSFGP